MSVSKSRRWSRSEKLGDTVRVGVTVALLLQFTACQFVSKSSPELVQSLDPGGCILEHVAVEVGVSQFQYDSFSPNGELIAIAWDRGDRERGTYLLDLDSWERTDVPTLNNGATFSPNGRYLLNSIYVANDNTDIVRYELDTQSMSFIAPHNAWDWLPSYSPDGRKIVFNSFRAGNSDVYLYDVKSEALTQLTNSANYEAHAQFSPDNEHIVYHEQVSETDFNINVMNLSDNSVTALTQQTSEESYPSWSPDGKYIAFASDRNQAAGITDIFVMTRTADVVLKVTNSPHKDAYPFWSPDGKYLYFNSYREPQGVYRTQMTDLINCRR